MIPDDTDEILVPRYRHLIHDTIRYRYTKKANRKRFLDLMYDTIPIHETNDDTISIFYTSIRYGSILFRGWNTMRYDTDKQTKTNRYIPWYFDTRQAQHDTIRYDTDKQTKIIDTFLDILTHDTTRHDTDKRTKKIDMHDFDIRCLISAHKNTGDVGRRWKRLNKPLPIR